MRNFFLSAAFAVIGMTAITAQDFGVKAGYANGNAIVKFDGDSENASESGFFVGAFVEIEAGDGLMVKPELLYTSVEETSFLQLPILGKFTLGEGGFNIQAGPQVNFVLEDTGDDFSAISVGLTAGLGFRINDNFIVEAHYNYQITNSYTGDIDDLSSRVNFLNVGLGYKF